MMTGYTLRNAEYRLCLERNLDIYEGNIDKQKNEDFKLEDQVILLDNIEIIKIFRQDEFPKSENTNENISDIAGLGEMSPKVQEFILKLQSRLSSVQKAQITAYVDYFGQFTSEQFPKDMAELIRNRYPSKENRLFDDVLVPRGVLFGCGDLIFSSHMIFSLVFVRTYQKYGTRRFIKQCAWFTAVAQSLLIIASRKHYTVDVVVAWYTVNLVVYFLDHKLPELPDRSGASFVLPLSKDSRTKEENHKLLNGNSGDPTDRRLRTQVNGKGVEDGNTVHAETAMNGV